MDIGIDARAATEEIAGRGRVVRELLRAFADRDDDYRYTLFAGTTWDHPLDDRFSWQVVAGGPGLFQRRAAQFATRRCDAYLAPNSYLGALFAHVPTATVVHDLVAFDRASGAPRRSQVVERLTLGQAVRRSAVLLAVSHATAESLVDRFPAASSKVRVMPLGVSPALDPDTPSRADVADGFVLAVGTLEPRKNFPRLVEAYQALPADLQQRHPLVVVGRHGWGTSQTVRALESLGERCHVLGAVPDDVLADLYRRCAVFCYPSLAEGFGLPVLEAMAAGAPVLTSDRSSLPEVGGDAVEYVDPTDTQDIARKLAALLLDDDVRADLGRRAVVRAADFSWDRTAEVALAAIEETARQRVAR
ncbi:MAG: glycosyltransferase family 4 protein [Actinomycetota bacterium]|nr:glycosyltransferase family 4 protein [Actinomycetota bacterium]